jgi:cell division protein FtsI (penicillin-binding protein 3)
MAFGHEASLTPIQLARAVAVIANGGKLVEPTLILERESVDPETGQKAVIHPRRTEPRQVIKPETAFTVRQLMQRVVEEGTGVQARIPNYTAGGKTGTAELVDAVTHQYLKNKNAASFVGFAPVANPRIVVVATVYGTHQKGGPAAGPVFSAVARTALIVMQVPPDKLGRIPVLARHKPAEEPALLAGLREEAAPVDDGRNLVGPRVPNFRGMSIPAVLKESSTLGVEVEIIGQGRARAQRPAPGAILPDGRRIRVEFARN